jgi:hypothetical protein
MKRKLSRHRLRPYLSVEHYYTTLLVFAIVPMWGRKHLRQAESPNARMLLPVISWSRKLAFIQS